jgi:hypothetical protein
MIAITCRLAKFTMDDTLSSPAEKLQSYARQITQALRETLQKVKPQLNRDIFESAAFVVLEQNMAEFVHNSIDACSLHNLPFAKQILTIYIPQNTKDDKVVIRYQDSMGGFPEAFMENKIALDYYEDKLQGKKIYVESEKSSYKKTTLIGGHGLALSQTCRFLKLHRGNLILKNKKDGAVLIFKSPIRPQHKKPSFNNFKSLDYQNVLAKDELATLKKSASRHDLSLLNIPARHIILQKLTSPRFNLPSIESDPGSSPWKTMPS